VFTARVVGEVVATVKHAELSTRKLLLVQPVAPGGAPAGAAQIAVDAVDAGPGDLVLVADEGNSASQVLHRPRGPVRTVVIGVVDRVDEAAP
jgi:ethanolamine utilization protein EutN